jgi:hypothetical protein
MTIITHPEYDDNVKIWELCEDTNHPTKVKDRGEVYLPFIGDKNNESDRERYQAYLKRAMFYGYMTETVAALSGMAFRDGITTEQVGTNSYIENDLDGDGVGIQQQAQSVLNQLLITGRGGLLVDYPVVEGQLTLQQQQAFGIRATITSYKALQIKNWHKRKIGGRNVLSLVSLSEVIQTAADDGLTLENVEQERRLVLDEDNLYQVEVYRDVSDTPVEIYQPTDSSGNRLGFIPFYFVGAMNNDATVDDAPLYSVASLNVGHYRNSADYETSVYYLRPQPYATGVGSDLNGEGANKGFKYGSGRLLAFTDPQAKFGIVQPEPNEQAFEAMNHKQEQMIALGAKLITNESSRFSTATEAAINSSSQTSKLAQMIGNIEQAYNDAFEVLGMMNGTPAPYMVINVDLNKVALDANLARLMLDAYMSGLIAKPDVRQYLRKHSAIERTDEEIDGDIEENAGLNLNDLGGNDAERDN